MSQTRQPSSQLVTTTETSRESSTVRLPATLRLRGEEDSTTSTREPSSSRRIRWSEDVVDNEGMGKKSSKGLPVFTLTVLSPITEERPLTYPSVLYLPQIPAGRREQF